jgi:PAS domain S-box-containing protein
MLRARTHRTDAAGRGHTPAPGGRSGLHARLARALASCSTEADLVQVLYAELQPVFGYDSINLQVLERHGWYHSLPIDRGVVQDVSRRPLAESNFAEYYRDPRPLVVHPSNATAFVSGRGPGLSRRPRTVIWMPLLRGREPVGSISYQIFSKREVPPTELAFLQRVHSHLGNQVAKVYRNELTRNQAVGLGALNVIARALSATRDEAGIVAGLLGTLSTVITVDRVELALRDDSDSRHLRLLAMGADQRITRSNVPVGSRRLDPIRSVLAVGEARLEVSADSSGDYQSTASVAVVEEGLIKGVLTTRCRQADAYEQSTLAFLQQVADQLTLALRNAWSYAELDAQRRRQEIVNAVGSSLTSSLDRWSIMRSLREALSRHLEFDSFTLATVTETSRGLVAEGYVWDSGAEQPRSVPLESGGPAREAYETGEPVLIRRSPGARSPEAAVRSRGDLVAGDGPEIDVPQLGRRRRVASRSILWVPVRRGQEVVALLSIQSHRAGAFDQWYVNVLEDVAAHAALALANADNFHAAQADRQRLEVLHLLEMGVQAASNEEQIADAVLQALRSYMDAPILLLGYLEAGRLTGYCLEPGKPLRHLPPVSVESTVFFKRQMVEGMTIAEPLPPPLRVPRPGQEWPTWGPLIPQHFLSVPLFNENRVVGGLSAQRTADQPFTADEIQLFESAAPVVAIGLRTVRLHQANELAMANSVRLQMVAGLAGNDLTGVVESVAELARSLLAAAGAACWAFDDDGRVAIQAVSGSAAPGRVLRWSGRTLARAWSEPPREPLTGQRGKGGWTLVPLWHGERLVGALGAVRPGALPEEPLPVISDFAQHAAIAIENARLAEETRGRIRTMEAVAAFANLDITRPAKAQAAICRLIEEALAESHGAMWMLEGSAMVRRTGEGDGIRINASSPDWWGQALGVGRSRGPARRLLNLIRAHAAMAPATVEERAQAAASAGRAVFANAVVVDGDVVGMVTADAARALPDETRRRIAVLAGQTGLALSRLNLVAELGRQTEMLTTVLRHSPLGVVLEDDEGNVAFANSEVERIYGVPAAALIGAPARSLLERPDATLLFNPEAESDAPLEFRLQGNGTVVQVRSVPIAGAAGRGHRVLTLHEDVTSERAVLEARDLMLRAIGHEVRSPAAAMRSTIAGLLQWGTVLDAGQRDALIVEAYEQSDRLLSLVENQLLISKLEARRFEPNGVRTSLARSVEQVVTVLRSRYGRRVQAVDSRIGPDLPDAHCEPTHLDEVLTNLIGNALEYTPARFVRVAARETGGWLEVSVVDDGAGLPSERLQSPFQKTAHPGRSRARGGLGLGLYLCKLVVERSFGGRIWLERTGPEGTTFKFTVPAVLPEGRRRSRSVAAARTAR